MYSFVFLSFFIYILYNLIIITKYEQTPSSLSETYYMLQKKGYWFQIMMVIIALVERDGFRVDIDKLAKNLSVEGLLRAITKEV